MFFLLVILTNIKAVTSLHMSLSITDEKTFHSSEDRRWKTIGYQQCQVIGFERVWETSLSASWGLFLGT
jgi:hypothetical protein